MPILDILVYMKLLAVGLWIACLSISAQDQPDNRVHFACVEVTPLKLLKCHTTLGYDNHVIADDRWYASGADFARHAKIGDPWWPVGGGAIVLTLAADDIRQEQRRYILTGHAEIHTTMMSLAADDAVYHSDTGEIESRGSVRVKPTGPLP